MTQQQMMPASVQGTAQPPVTAQQIVQAAPESQETVDALKGLVQLLLAERQDALEERKAKAQAVLAREAARKKNHEIELARKNQVQKICTHRKGGKHGPKSPKIDYAVYYHTFTDQNRYIRCQICGMIWRPGDTEETLVRIVTRNGEDQVIKSLNHTGISWKEAFGFLQQSSNTPSASEVVAMAPSTQPKV